MKNIIILKIENERGKDGLTGQVFVQEKVVETSKIQESIVELKLDPKALGFNERF